MSIPISGAVCLIAVVLSCGLSGQDRRSKVDPGPRSVEGVVTDGSGRPVCDQPVVGTAAGCALIANGTARDAPFNVVATNELPAAVAEIAPGIKHKDDHV